MFALPHQSLSRCLAPMASILSTYDDVLLPLFATPCGNFLGVADFVLMSYVFDTTVGFQGARKMNCESLAMFLRLVLHFQFNI